jgi:hypothetical protein
MSQYKVRNWSEYNESLKNRGSLFLWVSDDSLKKWQAVKDPYFIGAPKQFSDDAILCIMMLKSVFHLPYRQLIGFIISLFALMRVSLSIPHFTTVAKRASQLGCSLNKLSKRMPTDLVFDSSGFKVYGEGEWKVRQHGKQKRRRWKKFHIGICPASHEIVLAEATELETADCEVGPRLIRKAPRSIKRVIGDGAYDTSECYQSTHERNAKLVVPPRQGAVIREVEGMPWIEARNESIAQIIGLGNTAEARKLWKKLTGYHQRSLVETAFSRFKGIFGSRLFSKHSENQRVELLIKAQAMNRMTNLGMPRGIIV